MLVLLDLDGTLLHGTGAHTQALLDALEAVHGVRLTRRDVTAVGPAGRTDLEIARLLLRGAGVADRAVTARAAEWARAAAAAYPAAARRHPAPVAVPDARAALGALRAAGARLALLTGNLEPIGWAKVRAAGLGDLFPDPVGAFGGDHEDRAALVPLARARAGADGLEAVVVGDTPRDVACARAGGARCVAVATGPYGEDELRAAAPDAVAGSLAAAAAVIAGWMGAPAPR